jgi:FlaA1/EpsC-like NDP-sugar epimerase
MKLMTFHRNNVITLMTDILILMTSLYLCYNLRFDFQIPDRFRQPFLIILPVAIAIKIPCFYIAGLYRGMWRYTSIADMVNIIKASTLGTILLISMVAIFSRFEGFPRSVFLIDWGFTILMVAGFRLSIRFWFEFQNEKQSAFQTLKHVLHGALRKQRNRNAKRMVIIGAGDCGEQIYRELRGNRHLGYSVVGFIDDNPKKHSLNIHGIPVIGGVDQIDAIARDLTVDEFLIAIPSANGAQMRRIVDHCKDCGLPYKTIPSYGELLNGKVSVKTIRDVAYRDLLGREIIHLEEERIGACITGRNVLITGAGGSIGSELCRQVCRFKPLKLTLFERAESQLYDIDLELRQNFPDIEIMPVLGDILDHHILRKTFAQDRPAIVFHAAAYKHVPMLERQPWHSVDNNICGTMNVVEMANSYKVERFVFVSTDKAVRPANIMGTSKRIAEMIVQCHAGNSDTATQFMIVRFGNVVGSVGSVVPLFRKQIARGGPVTVTHPDVTRFFMTIPEACQLILQAGAMGKGGEIFILDMGTPIKIADMAKDLIRLSGFEPDVDIKIEYIGLRPGEKLYEELITKGEGIVPTGHKNILVLHGNSCDLNDLSNKIEQLKYLSRDQDDRGIREGFKKIVPEYSPAKV